MQSKVNQPKTSAELQELCNFLNYIHVRIWTSAAVIMVVCALIWNPYHLVTAALFLLLSRAKWDVRNLQALQ